MFFSTLPRPELLFKLPFELLFEWLLPIEPTPGSLMPEPEPFEPPARGTNGPTTPVFFGMVLVVELLPFLFELFELFDELPNFRPLLRMELLKLPELGLKPPLALKPPKPLELPEKPELRL